MNEFLAPNGNPSNLTTEQYKLVRTPEFKAWFGDWQNDPENSSKVVDENGEPLVVYHGGDEEFNIFDLNKTTNNRFHFTTDKEYAKFEKETDPKKKAALKKKIEDAINDKISVSTKGGVMSIAITVKDSNGKESAIPLFEAKISTRGIGAAPTFEMAQNTFGGLAFKYGTSDYTKWDEKDRKVVVGSSLNDLEEEFGN